MKILICGSRNFDDWDLFMTEMEEIDYKYDFDTKQPITIIEGGAIGADFCARLYAKYCAWEHQQFPANWKEYGKAAGSIRNKQMLDEGKPDLVVAFLAKDSKGTKNMIEQAELAGVPVKVINI